MAHAQRKTATRQDGSTRTGYRVRYLDPSGRERARDFERKKDADSFKDEQVAAMRRGEWVDPDAGGRSSVGQLKEGNLSLIAPLFPSPAMSANGDRRLST